METENEFEGENPTFAVTRGHVEVGKTYPIFGMITNVIQDSPGNVIVELNNAIEAVMKVSSVEKISLLKERAFEAGVFVSRVLEVEPKIKVACQTVLFGQSQSHHA